MRNLIAIAGLTLILAGTGYVVYLIPSVKRRVQKIILDKPSPIAYKPLHVFKR